MTRALRPARHSESAASSIAETRVQRFLWNALVIAVGTIPLFISPTGRDVFRLPKTIVFEAAAIGLTAIGTIYALYDVRFARRLAHQSFVNTTAAASVLWACVVTLLSLKPVVSNDAPLAIFCFAATFILVANLARFNEISALAAILAPAVVNAVIALFQATGASPITPIFKIASEDQRGQVIGLLGNPSYLGTYLLLPTIAAATAAFVWKKWRWWFVGVGVILFAAILTTVTLSTFAALGCAFVAFIWTLPSRKSRYIMVTLVVFGTMAILAFAPARSRLMYWRNMIETRRFVEGHSNRLPAYAVAWMMFRERPLVGVGPGVFSSLYMSYRLRLDEEHPEWIYYTELSFTEVHNDHLQLLAESGLLGYSLFVVLISRVAAMSFRQRPESKSSRQLFVSYFAFPGAVGFAVVALAQFPMHLTAAASAAVYSAGLCFAWDRNEGD